MASGINSISVTGGGSYSVAPAITFSAGAAAAVAILASGTLPQPVARIVVTAPGSYTVAPGVIFSAGTATATANLGWPAIIGDSYKPNASDWNAMIWASQQWEGNVNANLNNLANLALLSMAVTPGSDFLQAIPAALTGAGVQTGGQLHLSACSYDTGSHQLDFVMRARTTSNAGVGVLEVLSQLDGAGYSTLFTFGSGTTFYNSSGYQATAQTGLTAATPTPISFDSSFYDDGGIHSTSVNNSRFTAPVAGKYQATGSICFAATSQQCAVIIRINGSSSQWLAAEAGLSSGAAILSFATQVSLAANDYFEILGYVGGSSAWATYATAPEQSLCQIAKVG